jgi:Fe-S-cluster containining protein
MAGSISTREAIWLSCKPKTCCTVYTVFPTGQDLWRIATTLQVPPWSFSEAQTTEPTAPDAFQLDRSETRYRAVLRKGVPAMARTGSPACVFLIYPHRGVARCALGDGRPLPCRSFPAVMTDGLVHPLNDGGCACRTWTLADLDVEGDAALLLEAARHREVYANVVANWNAYVAQVAEDQVLSYQDFCRYVLDTYTQLSLQTPGGAH